MQKVDKCLESNKDNPNFGADLMKRIAVFTIPFSMFMAFLTRFNPEFQDMTYREIKTGALVAVLLFIGYMLAKLDDKRELGKSSGHK